MEELTGKQDTKSFDKLQKIIALTNINGTNEILAEIWYDIPAINRKKIHRLLFLNKRKSGYKRK